MPYETTPDGNIIVAWIIVRNPHPYTVLIDRNAIPVDPLSYRKIGFPAWMGTVNSLITEPRHTTFFTQRLWAIRHAKRDIQRFIADARRQGCMVEVLEG